MKCDEIAEVILSSGVLSKDRKRHVAKCKECSALADAVLGLDEAGRLQRDRDISPEAAQSVILQAEQITRERITPPHMRMKEWWLVQRLAAAAALLLAVGGAGILTSRLLIPHEEPEEPVANAFLASVQGIDGLRKDMEKEVSGFESRHQSDAGKDGLSREFNALRSQIAMLSVSVETELAGL